MTAKFSVTFGELRWKAGERGQRTIDEDCLPKFWNTTAGGKTGKRRGVYVFGIRAGKGWRPLYVGRTTRQTFETRIGQHCGRNSDFNVMVRGIRKGTPVLFLIARIGKGKRSTAVIDELETDFINYAFARNGNLKNDRKIRRTRYVIQGFRSRGKPSAQVKDLKLMVGYG